MSDDEFDDLVLAKLSERELQELSDFIDPDNYLLPASDRLPPQTTRPPTGPLDRAHLLTHLRKEAEESTVGEDYVPFVKKPSAAKEQKAWESKGSKVKEEVKTEFDDMLEMLDEEDIAELAAELGLHGLVSQAKSRGDDEPTSASANPNAGLLKTTGASYASYSGNSSAAVSSPYGIMPSGGIEGEVDPLEVDVEECLSQLQANEYSLTELNLNNNTKLSPEHISRLIENLQDNTHLQVLQLANVKFDDDHAKALGKVLSTNSTLRSLSLESNKITARGFKAFLNSIVHNTTLKELRLANQYNSGGARVEVYIADFLEKNKGIVKMGYFFNFPSARSRVDKYITRNIDLGRQRRVAMAN